MKINQTKNHGRRISQNIKEKIGSKEWTYLFDLIPPSEIGFEFVANKVVEERRVEEDSGPCTHN